MALMAHSPRGLGQVYRISSTLKSARLNTKILVSSTMMQRSGLILAAFTSDLQLVSITHLACAA
jgi:hypothetical protein